MAATAEKQVMYVGVDVSKDRLDVHVDPTGENFAISRNLEGYEELVQRLLSRPVKVVALEATGGFEVDVAAHLAAAGLPVAVVNPKQTANFTRALGLNIKTDQSDAAVIARFASAVRLEPRALPDAETLALAELLNRRRQLVQMITDEKQRAMRMVSKKALQDSVRRVLEMLERELERLDDDIDDKVKGSPLWMEKEELLTSVPGIGKVIARTLMADLPELGHLSNKQIAALTGLAPWTRESGHWRGKRKIGGGRATCRQMLFLAAMVASRHNPVFKAFKERLLNAGKPKMVVLTAIARKIITTLNAMIRDKSPWQPQRP